MRFADRSEAGLELAEAIRGAGVGPDLVLGLPRGGVPVAFEVSAFLGIPMDVIVVRKLGAPFQPELAMGALGEGGVRVENREVLRAVGLDGATLDLVVDREREELERRAALYRGNRPRLDLGARRVVIVDDGIATGSTARAAARVARAAGCVARFRGGARGFGVGAGRTGGTHGRGGVCHRARTVLRRGGVVLGLLPDLRLRRARSAGSGRRRGECRAFQGSSERPGRTVVVGRGEPCGNGSARGPPTPSLVRSGCPRHRSHCAGVGLRPVRRGGGPGRRLEAAWSRRRRVLHRGQGRALGYQPGRGPGRDPSGFAGEPPPHRQRGPVGPATGDPGRHRRSAWPSPSPRQPARVTGGSSSSSRSAVRSSARPTHWPR